MPRTFKASLLLFFLIVCGSALIVTHQLRQHLPAPVPRALFAIVNEQLIAFRASDFRSAYRSAATGVQQKFTPPQFEAMVRQNYPEMTRASRVEFGLVKMSGESALVQVFFFGANGAVRSFFFSLINEDDAWKIDGVEELRSWHRAERLSGSRT